MKTVSQKLEALANFLASGDLVVQKYDGQRTVSLPVLPELRSTLQRIIWADIDQLRRNNVESSDDDPQPIGKCSHCGTPVYSDEGFCGACGK